MKKRSILLTALLLAAAMLTGCTGGKEESKTAASLQVVLASAYVAEEQTKSLEAMLAEALPELNTDAAKLSVVGVSVGDPEKDPQGTMAGMARMAGMMAGKEMELLICDSETARRYADNGEAYVPLEQLFTLEEIAEKALVAAQVAKSDDEGNLTGEMSGSCGVNLNECTALLEKLKLRDLGAYVIVDSANQENAKAVMTYLASLK